MNKRLARILRTNAALYLLCLAAFVVAAVLMNQPLLALGEAVVTVIAFLVSRQRSKSTQQSMRQYMERITGGMNTARSSNMLYAPLPMMVFDAKTDEILWANDLFMHLTEQKDGLFEMRVENVVPEFNSRWLDEGKHECPELVTWDHRQYRVFGSLGYPEGVAQEDQVMATTYWMDVTEPEQLRTTLELTRPVVA